MPKSTRTLRAKLRDYAMSLPEATADFPWGERVAKVNKKVFAFLGRDMAERLSLGVKLKSSHASALTLASAKPMAYGLGKSGWVTAKLDDQSQASFEMLRDWVKESYCAVAPKGLAEQVRPDPSKAKAAKKAKAKTLKQEASKRKTKAEGRAKATSLSVGRAKRGSKT